MSTTESTDQAVTEATGTTGATEAEQALQDAAEATPEAEQAPEQAPEAEGGKAAREAAKYRRQLRAAETERDALVGQVEALRRAQVDTLAEGRIKPAALWASGVELEALLDGGGVVDVAKVDAAVLIAAEALGIRLSTGPYVPEMGSLETPAVRESFESAFGPQD